MKEQAALREFCVQNSLSASTKVFGKCGSWSRVPPPPPSEIEGRAGNLCVETNCCIPCGYHLDVDVLIF